MATIHEDLTDQVDGVTDTFTTINDIAGGIIVDHNGQVIFKEDTTILNNNNFQIVFVPQVGDTISVFVTPDRFDVTDQVDGVTKEFNKSDLDINGTGDFIPILNGQIKETSLTIEIPSSGDIVFILDEAPQIGDTLEYIRVQTIRTAGDSLPATGIIDIFKLNGIIDNQSILGIIKENITSGEVSQSYTVSGVVEQEIQLKGEIKV